MIPRSTAAKAIGVVVAVTMPSPLLLNAAIARGLPLQAYPVMASSELNQLSVSELASSHASVLLRWLARSILIPYVPHWMLPRDIVFCSDVLKLCCPSLAQSD